MEYVIAIQIPERAATSPVGTSTRPGEAVPAGMVAADAQRKLEGAEHAVDRHRDDVQHHRGWRREESGIIGGDRPAASEHDNASGVGRHRNEGERDQACGNQPIGFRRDGHGERPGGWLLRR
jgi:hypothetical protein